MVAANRVTQLTFLVVCVLGIQGKPSLSFHLPSIGPFRAFGRGRDAAPDDIKTYSGRRLKGDSIRMVYYHDQTVAVVELEPDKMLLNCELIEVYDPSEAAKALGAVVEGIKPPVAISFNEMTTLMDQCRQVEEANHLAAEEEEAKKRTKSSKHRIVGRGILSNNPFVLFNGIIPGTKWCGTGDIAADYFDLGAESTVDKCCRAHDLCPVKIRAYSNRYNLTNDSLYTKSHCSCDDDLYACLQTNESPTAHIMGNIYFNLVQVPCLEDTDKGRTYRKARNNF